MDKAIITVAPTGEGPTKELNPATPITPAEIAEDDFGFIESLGLKENLSPTRANGLVSMIETIRRAAQENL